MFKKTNQIFQIICCIYLIFLNSAHAQIEFNSDEKKFYKITIQDQYEDFIWKRIYSDIKIYKFIQDHIRQKEIISRCRKSVFDSIFISSRETADLIDKISSIISDRETKNSPFLIGFQRASIIAFYLLDDAVRTEWMQMTAADLEALRLLNVFDAIAVTTEAIANLETGAEYEWPVARFVAYAKAAGVWERLKSVEGGSVLSSLEPLSPDPSKREVLPTDAKTAIEFLASDDNRERLSKALLDGRPAPKLFPEVAEAFIAAVKLSANAQWLDQICDNPRLCPHKARLLKLESQIVPLTGGSANFDGMKDIVTVSPAPECKIEINPRFIQK